MSRKLKTPSQEIANLIKRIETKYKDSDMQFMSQVEGYFMSGLTVKGIELCLDENDTSGRFIKCLDKKVAKS